MRPELLSMPNIPKPLHGLNPRTIMGRASWDVKRREVYASTGHHCAACGVHKSEAKKFQRMEAHEVHEIDYGKGMAEVLEIVPLCHFCHAFIHSGLTRMRARKKEIKASEVLAIMSHGCEVLRSGKCKMFAGTAELCDLVKADRSGIPIANQPRSMADWSKWFLVWEGEAYKGKFKNFNAWQKSFT